MTDVYSIALSGMEAQKRKVDAHASNIANVRTIGSVDGRKQAYTPVDTVSHTIIGPDGTGVGVRTETVLRNPGKVNVYNPDSPFANEEGVVAAPDISLEEEIIGIQVASTLYKAGASIIRTQKEMDDELMDIIT